MKRVQARRVAAWACGALAVAAALLLGVLFWPGGGGTHGVVAKARAALGNGPILHLVYRTPSGMQLVELHGNRTIVPPYETESWTDRKLERRHLITRLNGEPISESVAPDALKGHQVFGTIDPAYAALWSGYRNALAQGTAKVERQGRLFGRPVYWLRFPPAGPSRTTGLVAVDRTTDRPLAFRYGRRFQARVLLAQLEAYDAADFRHRTNLNAFGSVSSSYGSSSSPRPARPWLTAGPTVAGLRQTSVGTTSQSRGGRGFSVDYGPESSSRVVRIDQLKSPPDRSDWRGIPRGFVGIIGGEVPGMGNRMRPVWFGNLVVDGVYVTIQAGSRRALVAAARALRPV